VSGSVHFSVVIPHYRSPEALTRALASVRAQTVAPSEVIVVDDASPGNQRPRLSDEDQTAGVRVIELNYNHGGPAAPRNVGIENSTGEFVAFLDADDIWHPLHLETLRNEIIRGSPDLVGSTIRDFSDYDNMPALSPSTARRIVTKREVLIKSPFATSATALRRSLTDEFKFDESPAYRAVEDIDLWQRLTIAGAKCVKLRAETVWYLSNPKGISAGKLRHLKKIYRVILKNSSPGSVQNATFYIRLLTVFRFGGYCVASFVLRKLWRRL
jgi:glycosyltransferase involved in cell wall biosynthesis